MTCVYVCDVTMCVCVYVCACSVGVCSVGVCVQRRCVCVQIMAVAPLVHKMQPASTTHILAASVTTAPRMAAALLCCRAERVFSLPRISCAIVCLLLPMPERWMSTKRSSKTSEVASSLLGLCACACIHTPGKHAAALEQCINTSSCLRVYT